MSDTITLPGGKVVAVAAAARHRFSKSPAITIRLVAGLGVEGDAHAGATVMHVWDRKRAPHTPNLRQVHLVQAELFDTLRAQGFKLVPGDIGENITTSGIGLAALPRGARLHLGDTAIIELTGLRTPCSQIEAFQPGLLGAVTAQDAHGRPVLRDAVMAIVLNGGDVTQGDDIRVEMPDGVCEGLAPV
jgi:MOSC domain-containing protein YiiM